MDTQPMKRYKGYAIDANFGMLQVRKNVVASHSFVP